MNSVKILIACACAAAAISWAGCAGGNKSGQPSSQPANSSSAATPSPVTAGAATGVEKVKPAPGTGNVQGKVLYNGKPVENIEVKLCEKFNRFLGGCGDGKTFTARTDKDGEYVITNVEPKVYEGLMARVFETDMYVFATTGIAGLSSTKYEVSADKTLFAQPTNLFKGDLKLLSPKAGAKVSAQNLELKWEPYPDAAYYKFSIHPEEMSVTSPYINERVDATSYAVDKPLQKGTYRWQVTAYNGADQKLSESADDIKFTITEP
ncbi:MAG: transthyretin-like family protein [Acidobacteria bacterium]|nr:transthyretin-like family protein [Acidobacteriota bacterium]MCA1641700.1 transthyretin-like family protein [Acidobacteriota bacterium]